MDVNKNQSCLGKRVFRMNSESSRAFRITAISAYNNNNNLIYCLQNIQIILFTEDSIVLRMRTIQPIADALFPFYLKGVKIISNCQKVSLLKAFKFYLNSDPTKIRLEISNRIKFRSFFISISSDFDAGNNFHDYWYPIITGIPQSK